MGSVFIDEMLPESDLQFIYDEKNDPKIEPE